MPRKVKSKKRFSSRSKPRYSRKRVSNQKRRSKLRKNTINTKRGGNKDQKIKKRKRKRKRKEKSEKEKSEKEKSDYKLYNIFSKYDNEGKKFPKHLEETEHILPSKKLPVIAGIQV